MAYRPINAKKSPFEVRMAKIAIILIRAELVRCNGDKLRTAASLGIPKYSLYRYLNLATKLEDTYNTDRELEMIAKGLKCLIGE